MWDMKLSSIPLFSMHGAPVWQKTRLFPDFFVQPSLKAIRRNLWHKSISVRRRNVKISISWQVQADQWELVKPESPKMHYFHIPGVLLPECPLTNGTGQICINGDSEGGTRPIRQMPLTVVPPNIFCNAHNSAQAQVWILVFWTTWN